MSDKNTVSHDYMSDKKNFADIWNYYIHGGRQVIKPEDLVDKDPVEEAVMKKFKTIVTAQKYRDILKGVTIKSDGRRVYAILGIENQSDIHYAMPVRNSLYDALDYAAQVTEIARQNRKAKKAKNSAEFLSGFTEKDKLIPVITLVINWGLAPESVNVINTFTGAKISLDDKEGAKIIMCKGIEMMIEEGRKEGRKEALKEGIEGAVNILRGLGQSDEEIAAAICRQFDLKPEEAKKYM